MDDQVTVDQGFRPRGWGKYVGGWTTCSVLMLLGALFPFLLVWVRRRLTRRSAVPPPSGGARS